MTDRRFVAEKDVEQAIVRSARDTSLIDNLVRLHMESVDLPAGHAPVEGAEETARK